MSLILVIENDPMVSRSLQDALGRSGHQVDVVASIAEARSAWRNLQPDLILLDLELSDGISFGLCSDIHEERPTLPIIIVTASLDEESAVKGLSHGAVDYIRKPFGKRELLLRIKRILGDSSGTLRVGGLSVNKEKRVVIHEGQTIALSTTEIKLLALLMERVGESVPKEKFLANIDKDVTLSEKTLSVYVSRLRTKLKEHGVSDLEISPVYGMGYRMDKVK